MLCTILSTRQGCASEIDSTSWIVVQAGIAILCLCGFESITALGEEAKDAKKHIPWAVLIALTIQGGFCYLFEFLGPITS